MAETPFLSFPKYVRKKGIRSQIGRYEIVRLLARGGMAAVYAAKDPRLNRHVAIKCFQPLWGLGSMERFFREAQLAASLEHPHIGTLHEMDETEDGCLFIVMTYYEGGSLRTRLEQGPLTVAESLNIAVQLARGLVHVSRHGIIHRDIKPENIMFTGEGIVKIVDFGVAIGTFQSRLTLPGSVLGTPGYMSPEQAKGQPVDVRADIWALGVVLYEMLTGQLPFPNPNGAMYQPILEEEAPPLRNVRRDVPVTLSNLVKGILKRKMFQRQGNLSKLLADLETLHHECRTGPQESP